MRYSFEPFDLQLFAEGASGDAGGEGVQQTAAGDTAAAAGQQGAAAAGTAAEGQVTSANGAAQTAADRQKAFEEMIRGEYKDLYDKRVQDTVKRRLKSFDGMRSQLDGMTPVMQVLGQRYGVDGNDPSAILKALEADDTYYSDKALKEGLTVDQVKFFDRLERENAVMRLQQQEAQRQLHAQQQYSAWMQQAEEVKAFYPGFDLETELANDDFTGLLKAGVGMKAAYMACHSDDLIADAMRAAVATTKQQISAAVQANVSRPAEGAVGAGASAAVKPDPSKMSAADIEEIRKRVARGERISF